MTNSNPLNKNPFIIADVGGNHRGRLELAYHHIDIAKACGADAVKFQLYTPEELYGVPHDMKNCLRRDWIPKLEQYAQTNKIEFMCTAFSPDGVEFIDKFVNVHKVASAEMCYLPLIDAVIKTGKPFIVSTGGAHAAELAPLKIRVGSIDDRNRMKILECVAAYPAPIKAYDLSWCLFDGISDHTRGTTLAIAAVGAGATIFEKHFDALRINKPLKDSPDSHFSMGPRGLANYCKRIREAFTCLNGGNKMARQSEMEMTTTWRRRLKIIKPVKGGQDILKYGENFGIFRSLKPDTRAAAAWDYQKFDGHRVKRDMNPQDGLWFDDIE